MQQESKRSLLEIYFGDISFREMNDDGVSSIPHTFDDIWPFWKDAPRYLLQITEWRKRAVRPKVKLLWQGVDFQTILLLTEKKKSGGSLQKKIEWIPPKNEKIEWTPPKNEKM